MKKLLFILSIVLAISSCESQFESPDISNEQTTQSDSKLRSIDEVYEIAANFLGASTPKSRGNNTPTLTKGAYKILCSDAARSSSADTLIYALDFDNAEGFILVSAPYNVEPILAVIDSGSFDDESNLDNEPYQMMLNMTKDYVSESQKSNNTVRDDTIKDLPIGLRKVEEVTIYSKFLEQEPSVEVQWGQTWPENIFAPNGIAGCTPVAIGQLLSVFELPKSISYTFPNRDINTENLNWDEIKMHKNILDCSDTYTNHRTIARIIREIGHRAGSNYNEESTSTSAHVEENVIRQFTGLSSNSYGTSTSELFAKFSESPGAAVLACYAHAFVADAIKHYKYKCYNYIYYPDDTLEKTIFKYEAETKLIHYNWGWNGNCNGFFLEGILNTSKAYTYDFKNLGNTGPDYQQNSIYFYFYKTQY